MLVDLVWLCILLVLRILLIRVVVVVFMCLVMGNNSMLLLVCVSSLGKVIIWFVWVVVGMLMLFIKVLWLIDEGICV